MYDEVCLWYWGLDESGNGFVENLIWGNKIKVDAEIMNEILQCSDVQVMQEEIYLDCCLIKIRNFYTDR